MKSVGSPVCSRHDSPLHKSKQFASGGNIWDFHPLTSFQGPHVTPLLPCIFVVFQVAADKILRFEFVAILKKPPDSKSIILSSFEKSQ